MMKTSLLAAAAGAVAALSVSPVLAADPLRPAPVAPVVDAYTPYLADDVWTGFYAGAHAGGVFTGHDGDDGKILGGVQAGYNQQFGQFVLGAELGASFADELTHHLGGGAGVSQTWLANASARAGFALDHTLIYGTVGVAFTEFEPQGTAIVSNDTRAGLSFGAGVEHQFGNGLGAKLEYTQARFNDVDVWTTGGGYASSELVNHTFKAGLNFHF